VADLGPAQQDGATGVPDPGRSFGTDSGRNLGAQDAELPVGLHGLDQPADTRRVDNRVVVEHPGVSGFVLEGPTEAQICPTAVPEVSFGGDDDDRIAELGRESRPVAPRRAVVDDDDPVAVVGSVQQRPNAPDGVFQAVVVHDYGNDERLDRSGGDARCRDNARGRENASLRGGLVGARLGGQRDERTGGTGRMIASGTGPDGRLAG